MNYEKNVLKLFGVLLISVVFLLLGKSNFVFADSLGSNMSVEYQTCVQNNGWQNSTLDGQVSGIQGKSLGIEATKIMVDNPINGIKIKYQAQVERVGWQDWVYDGETAGIANSGLRMEAIKIMLEGAPDGFHIQYAANVESLGWQNWVQDGDVAGTVGPGLKLEGIKIRIVKNDSALSGGLGVKYNAHVQNIGWENEVYDGQLGGTQEQGLRVEAMNISIVNPVPGMKIKYKTHVQTIGWQDWKYDGDTTGTSGKSLRLEGIEIALEGAPQGYHVAYQAHIQNIGWQNWVADGAMAGTTGKALRMEAIRVIILKSDEQLKSLKKMPTYAIDIGHNANFDSGATGIKQEDVLTKEVGLKVISKLRNLGYNVIDCSPSNTTSVNDSLQQRVDKANKGNADYFMSIHFNKFNGQAKGTEIYAASDLMLDKATKILNNMVALGYYRRSIHLDSNFFVVKYTTMPSILVECSFVDNVEDMNRYNSEDIANALVNGLISSN
jgi:N-acetylmuramoyl-L-alanine amidase